MTKNFRSRSILLSMIGAVALVLTAAPMSMNLAPSDSLTTLKVANAGQPQSGQPGHTEGQPGPGGPAPGQRGGGGQNHNNGKK